MIRGILKILFFSIVLPTLILSIVTLGWAPAWIIGLSVIGVLLGFIIFILILIFSTTSKESKYNRNISLYQWMDDLSDFDQKLIYSLKKQYVGYGTLDNLNQLKNMLVKQTHNEKSTLKMYRAFYKQKLRESGEQLYLKTILISTIPVGVIWVNKQAEVLENVGSTYYLILIGLVIFAVAMLSVLLSVNKKRYGIIIEMIDICIEDIEDEENQMRVKEAYEEARIIRKRKVRRIIK